MKRSEMLLKMQRFYGIRHVMLEGGYITLEQFMAELLDYQESLGMKLCEKRDLGEIGKLWTPKGWDDEDEENPNKSGAW